jgi:hypothetical protein
MREPSLTVVAVFFEMRREAARTLYTLSPEYQRGVEAADYEVVAIDNGSTDPLSESEVTRFGSNFKLMRNPRGHQSPAAAINQVAAEVSTPWLMCLVDGARMLTPGILVWALRAFREHREPFVYTIGMHLGPASQNDLVEAARLAVGPSRESLVEWIQHLEGSRSWRITRPLRSIAALLRRLLRRRPSPVAPPALEGVEAAAETSNQSLVEWIHRLEGSRSWRITRPLRSLAAFARRLLRRSQSQPALPAPSDEQVRGYSREAEDRLLDSVDWRRNGYELFTISTPAASVGDRGFTLEVWESNCFALRRETYLEAGGFDERFRSPGGGLVNLDLFKRLAEDPKLTPICLLGEATFHQFHGGVATNVSLNDHPWDSFEAEYEAIRGQAYHPPIGREPLYLGEVPEEARYLVRSETSLPG